MTLREWVSTREPAPPHALAERLDVLIAPHDLDGADPADVLLDVALALLTDLLREGSTSRQTALDLLAADALVTYAFEAASDDPLRLDARAGAAMARLSELATRA